LSTNTPKFFGTVLGSFSKPLETEAEAIEWVSKQLDLKTSATEGYVLEATHRVRKASPPLVTEPIIPQPKFPALEAEKPGHDYSNEKHDDPVGRTHIGQIGAGYDFGNAPGA